MEERILSILMKLINTVELDKIESMRDDKTILFHFAVGIRLFIDSTSEGIDFSLTAQTLEAEKIIDDIENSLD
jgi:hypothetical protein